MTELDYTVLVSLNKLNAIDWLRENIYMCYLCPLHDKTDFWGRRRCKHFNIRQRAKCLAEIKKFIHNNISPEN
jgi:hypothetical protein